MFKFLKIQKEFTKKKNYENLIKKNFLKLNNFNLKLINDRLKDCQEIFLEYFIFLNEIKFNEHNLIKNSYLLFNELKNNAEFKTNEFIKEKYNDDNLLNAKNILLLNEPKFANKISLNIKNFYIDELYNFNIIIEGIDKNKNFIKINKNIFPINYGGQYIEKIKYNENYISLFEVENDKIKFFDTIDKKEIKINYFINENGYIIINKDVIFNENIQISYYPNLENLYVDCNFYITKIYLNTNFKYNNIKKINFIKEESNV